VCIFYSNLGVAAAFFVSFFLKKKMGGSVLFVSFSEKELD